MIQTLIILNLKSVIYTNMAGLKLTGETLFMFNFACYIARLVAPKLILVKIHFLKLSGGSMDILSYSGHLVWSQYFFGNIPQSINFKIQFIL